MGSRTLRFPCWQVSFLITFAILVVARLVFGEVGTGPVDEVVPTESWLLQVLNFVAGAKGLTVVALAAGITQLVMIGFKTPLAAFAGKVRLVIVAALTAGSLVLASMAAGADLLTALGQAPVLTAVQVLVHQVWKQFIEKTS